MQAAPQQNGGHDARVSSPESRSVGRAPLAGIRVLAVEDHEDSLELLCDLLTDAGALVTGANCVARALAEPGPFDIIVSDIGMPVADGYELIRQIRAREVDGDVPVIALTAFSRREDVARTREAGFQAHVAKPFNLDELTMLIRRWARSH